MLRFRFESGCGEPRRKYRLYDPDALTKAYVQVKEQQTPVREAARLYGVPETTLRQRVHGVVHIDTVKSGPSPIMPLEQEAKLADHIAFLAKVGYGYTRSEVCNLATELCVDLGIKLKQSPLSLQWFRNFLGRWPSLVVKKPQALEIARAKATSEETVGNYFQELKRVMVKYGLENRPERIYNIDEKGVADHSPPMVVSDRTSGAVSVTSGKVKTVTILGAGNAIGTAIPPYFVFPGQRMRSELLEGATPGTDGCVTASGWSNSEVFRNYITDHFIKYAQGRDDALPILLLYDGHKSHVTLDLIDWAREQNIILFVLPPHTSHVLQPLDVGCFGPFQKIYSNERAKFMREHSSSVVPNQAVCRIACKAYSQSLTANNLRSAFKKSGIHPLNPSEINKDVFIPSTIFPRYPDSVQQAVTDNSQTPDCDLSPSCGSLSSTQVPVCKPAPPVATQCSPTTSFFSHKINQIVDAKSKQTKKRKVLSKIVGGKAITEDAVRDGVIEHLARQPNNKSRKITREGKKKYVPPYKSLLHRPEISVVSDIPPTTSGSVMAGPSAIRPSTCSQKATIVVTDSESDFVEDGEVCCICGKFQPDGMKELGYIEFIKWGQCSVDGCGHWVHLKYCTALRVLRRHDVFHCPCHQKPGSALEE